MSTIPKITIITPSFNQGKFIERTIKSVLDQDYPNLEYLVMDGGSSDETIDILKKYEPRLTWISEKDKGQADAINKGIKMSTGDIVAYLNSDDIYEPYTLREVAQYFTQHAGTMWLTGKCRIIDKEDREARGMITHYKNFLLRHYSYNMLLVTNPISQPATFWRRSAINEFGLFNVNEHLVMDYDYWLRIGKKYPLAVLNKYLASFRVYASSKTSSSFLTTFRREMMLARKHSSSILLNSMHWISYICIAAAYLVLNSSARLNRKR
jgi:glycosyltransferase involved in cell wall biosynthesis